MEVTAVTVGTLSAALRRTFQATRRQVLDAATRYGAIRETITEIAPRVIGLYNSIKNENPRFTFAEFARLYDPSVPMQSADYKLHKVYYTLQYMQRVVSTGGRARNAGGVRTSATEALARTIATMLQLPGVEAASVFAAVKAEFGYGDRVMARLERRVKATQPLFNITVPRANTVRVGNVIHMVPPVAPAAGAAAPAAGRAAGRRRAAA